jgi:hypothetical protein
MQIQGADKFRARVPHTITRNIVHINMYPETFNLWLDALKWKPFEEEEEGI